jgi:hypothetical protein
MKIVKGIKRYVAAVLLLLAVAPKAWSIDTPRHIERIVEQLPCTLPQGGTFTCSQLNLNRQLYVERRGEAITQVGVRLFTRDIRSSLDHQVCNAVERLWLELVLAKTPQKQKSLMKEHRFSVVYNGFTLGTAQFPTLDKALSMFTPNTSFSMNAAEGKITLRAHLDDDALVITLPADRELLFAYDKKEHEDLIREELAAWDIDYSASALPSVQELRPVSDGIYVLPGRAYMIDSLKNETFYTLNGATYPAPLFSKDYPLMSLQNLMMGCVPTAKVDLHARYRTYDRSKVYCDISLSRFLGYMQRQGLEFYSAAYHTESGDVQCLLLMHHPVYDYIHMLVISHSPSLFLGGKTTLNGDFYTFIPQHNIKSLFNF